MVFIIWLLLGIFFIWEGIYCIRSKKDVAIGFWTNGKKPLIEEKNIKAYNKALGKLWCVYGVLFILLGIPVALCEQNSPFIILSSVGIILEVIALIVIYVKKIEGKYKKK
ncbi:hypothetical protein [Paraclostridium bifermentans]|uniref:hypothetical protein n=1 Tax=Paraclostridium bifermentans TaxID=1490 RepID=UPI00359C8247